MFKYFTIDNFEFEGKTVGTRVDINSPIINKKVAPNERIVASAKTLKELSERGAKVVAMAHQGRAGTADCVSLKEHAKLLSKEVGKEVKFIPEIYSKKVEEKIKSLKEGEILLIENLRFCDDETHPKKKGNLILNLEKLFDFYVFDAFSVSHREQTSVTGFKKVPNIAGKIMQKELMGLNEIEETKRPHVFVFGGAKPDDLVELIESGLEKDEVDIIMLTGVIGEIALHIKGYDIGKKYDFLEEHKYIDSKEKIKKLLDKYSEKFVLPRDVAVEKNGKRIEIKLEEFEKHRNDLDEYLIQDIGKFSVEYLSTLLKSAGSIYFKGPAGNFELKGFDVGTKGVIKGIVNSGAFTFMGGGHSVTAAKNFNFLDKFSYVSLAGGALVKFLSGKKLPGVENLEQSHDRFEKVYEDFVVIGSNTMDIGLNVPEEFSQIQLGDKIKLNEDFKTSIGGGGVNVSVCLARLGAKVGYLGKMSHESFDRVKEVFDKNKVNLIKSKISKRPAAKSVLLDTKDNDRVIFTYRGQNSYLESSDFDINDFRSNHYYFNSLMGDSFDTLIETAKKIRKRNKQAVICYNTSSYIIKTEPKIKNLVKNVDILILNYEEAQELVGEGSISKCLREIKKLVSDLAVITDGANGAYAYDGKKEWFVKSYKPKRIVDTTGAGDCFAGTFFYFHSKGYGIKKSLHFAAKNASSVVSMKGTQDGLLYYEDVVKK